MTEDSDRSERLTGLARVWSQIYFYHPSRTVPDERWENLLVATIPRVESAATPEAYAAALNDGLLRHLDDPWTYAALAADERFLESASFAGRLPAERRTLGAGYLDATDLSLADRPDYLNLLSAAVGELSQCPAIVLDLRWPHPPDASPWPEAFGFFLREPVRLPGVVERLHAGWSEAGERGYQETRLTRSGHVLMPLKPFPMLLAYRYPATDFANLSHYDGRLAVLVNDNSIGWLDDTLAGLQAAGRVFIVHESEGRVRLPQGSLRLWGGVEVQARLYQLTDATGRIDLRPDRVLPHGTRDDAIRAAEELLASGTPSGPLRQALRFPEPALSVGQPPSPEPPAREERLLALCKLWAVLGEFFPHLELADLEWPRLIVEWSPRFEAAESFSEYIAALMDLAARLNDSHVSVGHPLASEILGTHTPPVSLRPVEGRSIVGALAPGAEEIGFRRGMIVTHVDGQPVEDRLDACARLISASTPQIRTWMAHHQALAGAEGAPTTLTFLDGDQPREITTTRSNWLWSIPVIDERGEASRVEDGFGYIDLTRIVNSEAFDAALRSMLHLPGLILDMRGYPRFVVQRDVVSRLIDRPVSGTQFHVPLRSALQRRSWHVSTMVIEPHAELRYTGPVVVLIDVRAVSAAEDFCIYLRNSGRATFVGSPTAGTNGNVSFVRLPGGVSLTFTGMRVLHGDGSRFQNIGILPDVHAEPTIASNSEGRDEVLEAGVETLRHLTRVLTPSSAETDEERPT